MSPNFKQTYDSAAESKPFQHYIQVYAQTFSYDVSEVDEFYRELVSSWSNTKRGILVVQGDWNAKVGDDAQED